MKLTNEDYTKMMVLRDSKNGNQCWSKGIPMSEKQRKKIGLALKGKKKTKEHIKKLSESNKGQIPWNKGKKGLQTAWNKGKPWSEKSKKKMSKTKKILFKEGKLKNCFQKGHSKSKHHTKETKEKISYSLKKNNCIGIKNKVELTPEMIGLE